ncbi:MULTISPECIES: glycosyl hydrolase family 28-related protein [Sphingomonas]|jgi:hypothetical protein|uniref:glycosyl hydrolase family 28-related protein n=3 Tax=Pseudomonadota TaxID=1224 RepID=UPI001AE24B89
MPGWPLPFRVTLLATLMASAMPVAASPSYYATAPDDPRAITVAGARDGHADDTTALQTAIDAAAAKGGGGIVFVPSGRYRISRTLFVWPGVRVFGVGKTRPVLVLGDATPGFQQGLATMVMFAGAKPGATDTAKAYRTPFPPPGSVPFNPDIADANPGTFYPALSNIDFAIGKDNAAATAIRFHAAQHAYLAHIDFDLGSGLAGLYHVANQAQDLHFHGGRYGILTEKPSPAWQFTLLDSSFDGQRESAIREHEASLTLVNVAFRNVPTAIDIDRGYGDWLWGKDVRFENVRNAAVVISNENNVYTQIGFQNAVASATPTFARFRDSGRTVAGAGRAYRVTSFGYGLMVPALGQTGSYRTVMDAAPLPRLPAPPPRAIRQLPATDSWANVRQLGARGDDKTDDTAAIQRAIDTHRTVYFPAGRYHVTDTLRLRPDSVLVALHPSLTQLILPDGTPAFQGVGSAKALIESARGGDAIVSGLGLFTGGINPRATALLWHAGAQSLVEDVKFQGGHGTDLADGSRFDPYNANHTGDANPAKRWDAQYPSLWVRGGGGTFANLWSPNTYAQAGMLVSDSDTPGHVYQMSSEHHVRAEFVLDHVAHWEFLAPQTEEEAGESQDAVSFDIRHSHDILIANYHAYRVTRSLKPAPTAVRLTDTRDLHFRNVHVNAESGFGTCDENGCATYLRASKFPYENAIQDVTRGLEVREREFAALDLTSAAVAAATPGAFADAKVEKLASGFYAAAGAAIAPDGTLYFVDHHQQRIYAWSRAEGLRVVNYAPLDPVNLAVDRSGDLLVLSSEGRNGTVYSLTPNDADVRVIPSTPAVDHPGARTVLPVNYWVNGEFKDQLDPRTYTYPTLADMFDRDMRLPKAREYVSPDGSLVLPAYRTFQQGPSNFLGWRFSDALDSYGFTTAEIGGSVFVTNASENKTYRARLAAHGALTDLAPFANRGGESVASDAQGRVYIANGQVFVFAADGAEIGRIDIPERPLQLLVDNRARKTLFVVTHHAVYSVAIP